MVQLATSAPLVALVAHHCGCAPGPSVHVSGDADVSSDHVGQGRTELDRAPRPLPRLVTNPEKRDLFASRCGDIGFEDEEPRPAIGAPVAV